MAASDFFSSSKVAIGLDPEAYAVGAVGAGPEIDTKGFRWAVFDLLVGDSLGTYTFQVEETDVTGFGGTVSDVSGATASVTASDDDTVFRVVIDLQQRDQFLRVKAGTVGTGAVDLACSVQLYMAKDTANSAATTPTATVLS